MDLMHSSSIQNKNQRKLNAKNVTFIYFLKQSTIIYIYLNNSKPDNILGFKELYFELFDKQILFSFPYIFYLLLILCDHVLQCFFTL